MDPPSPVSREKRIGDMSDRDKASARQGQIVAIVIALAGLAAIFAPVVVQSMGLPLRYEMLIYFAALGAFVWAFLVAYRLWKSRND